MSFLTDIGSSRLALGTVQFGMNYGVANLRGKVSYDQAVAMLDEAAIAGIDTLDTAIAYGDSEKILGQIGVTRFHVITKLPAISTNTRDVENWVVSQVETSLKRLGVSRLRGVMMHAPDDLLGPYGRQIVKGLERAQQSGFVESLGISVYSPDQVARLIDCLNVAIVQVPFNVFDRRFAASGWLDRLAKNGVEIHARSVFLQGLLLMPPQRLPEKFASFTTDFDRWHKWLENDGVHTTAVEACIAHVSSYEQINRIVVGVDSLEQLRDVIAASNKSSNLAPEEIVSLSTALIDPSRWNTL